MKDFYNADVLKLQAVPRVPPPPPPALFLGGGGGGLRQTHFFLLSAIIKANG